MLPTPGSKEQQNTPKYTGPYLIHKIEEIKHLSCTERLLGS